MGIIGQFDQAVLRLVEKLPSSLHSLMVVVTSIGSPLACVVLLILVIIWAHKHKNKRLAYSGAVLILAMPLANLLKELTKRVRPNSPYVENMLFKTYSFPSGHAYASLLTFGLLACLAWRHMLASWQRALIITGLVLLIVLVGISRIYLGAHFPTDVVGGWILGMVILYATIKYGLETFQRK